MSYTENKTLARRFVEEIFYARKTEMAKNFVTPDIIYHGMAEVVRGLEEFKRWGGRRSLRISRYEGHNIRRFWRTKQRIS